MRYVAHMMLSCRRSVDGLLPPQCLFEMLWCRMNAAYWKIYTWNLTLRNLKSTRFIFQLVVCVYNSFCRWTIILEDDKYPELPVMCNGAGQKRLKEKWWKTVEKDTHSSDWLKVSLPGFDSLKIQFASQIKWINLVLMGSLLFGCSAW